MIKPIAQELGYAPPVTFTTNDHLYCLFQEPAIRLKKLLMTILQPYLCFKRLQWPPVAMITLLWSASVTTPISPVKSPIWKPPTPEL